MRWIYAVPTVFLCIVLLAIEPTNVFAQNANCSGAGQSVCSTVKDNQGECIACVDKCKAWTAIGCIDSSPGGFATQFFTIGTGIGGGIAFLLILFGGFQILTSAGNPEQLNAGRELVISAITGLLLIIFSVFLLRLIGVDILGLPGFS